MTDDLDALFTDFAVVVSWGSAAFSGILDTPDEILAGGTVLSTEYNLLVRSSNIVGLQDGESISIDGVDYAVRSVRLVDDGKISRLTLSRE